MSVARTQVVSVYVEPHTKSTSQLAAEKAARNFEGNLIYAHCLSLVEKRAAREPGGAS